MKESAIHQVTSEMGVLLFSAILGLDKSFLCFANFLSVLSKLRIEAMLSCPSIQSVLCSQGEDFGGIQLLLWCKGNEKISCNLISSPNIFPFDL